jgi:hypothetical protein
VFEVRQRVRYPRLQSALGLIHLRTDQGDEGPTGNEDIGQTERIGRIMILEHLLKHAIRHGFRVIQECHSAFLGACRAPLVAGGGRGLVRLPGQTCTSQRAVVVGHDRHGEAQGVTSSRAWGTPCHAVPQGGGRFYQAGRGLLGGAEPVQTPQDGDRTPRGGPGGTALSKRPMADHVPKPMMPHRFERWRSKA